MAETAADSGTAYTGAGPVAAALVRFERAVVAAEVVRVTDAGARAAEYSAGLATALDAAAAAGGASAGVPGGLVSGPALAECAALLSRRAREAAGQAAEVADGMSRAADLLVHADEEVAGDVSGAVG